MTNPFGAARWDDAGWRPPTPHQILALMLLCAVGVPLVGLVPPGSVAAKLCELLALACGGSGIYAAKNYLSPQVRRKLESVDARGLDPQPAQRVYANEGATVNPVTVPPEDGRGQ